VSTITKPVPVIADTDVKNVAIGDINSADLFESGSERRRAPTAATAKKL
jgi:hypothetical protein